jgi:hypothetical protein
VKNLLLSIASIEAEGLESVVLGFLFAEESPRQFLESKMIEAKNKKSLFRA